MPTRDLEDDRVLILAPGGRDAQVLDQMLSAGGLASEIAGDGQTLVDAILAGQRAGAIVTEEALLTLDRAAVRRALEGQPPWSDFPIMLLSRRGAPIRQGSTYVEGLGNVTILERPLHPATLISAARSAIRARRRQRGAQALLAEREEAEAALRDLAATLEQKVAARTRELAQANDRLTAEIVERERAEAQLLQSQKIEAIGQLTGGVAHDFNNLLTAVIGSLDLLLRRTEDPRLLTLARNALQAAERGAKLTAQLLAFSRRQRLAPAAVDGNAVVSQMHDLLSRSLGAHVRLETDLDPQLWAALVDPTQFEVMLLNLAINARDAMPGGGRLTISTRNVETAPEGIPELAPGPYVAVSVADTGSGMSEQTLARAFEPFFTTKPQGKGTGLGLSQVYGFARQSGGSVTIDSHEGAGTTVTIYLPRTVDLAGASAEPLKRRSPQRKGRILLVDDDPDVRTVAEAMLSDLGHDVTAVESASHALAALREARFDLMLTDVAMPGMNGVELAARVREIEPDLPVLFASGYADVQMFGETLDEEDVVKKPYGTEALGERVQGALKKAARRSRRSADLPIDQDQFRSFQP